jgi:hypothetical protein
MVSVKGRPSDFAYFLLNNMQYANHKQFTHFVFILRQRRPNRAILAGIGKCKNLRQPYIFGLCSMGFVLGGHPPVFVPSPSAIGEREQRYLILEYKVGIFEGVVHQDDEFTHDGSKGDFAGLPAARSLW